MNTDYALINKMLNYINSAENKKFEWGTFDCAQMMLQAMDLQLGVNEHGNRYVKAYSCKRSALRFMKTVVKPSEYLSLNGAFIIRKPYLMFTSFGDFIVVQVDRYFEAVHLCLGQTSFSVDEKLGAVLCDTRTLLKSFDESQVYVYRLNRSHTSCRLH